VKTKNYTGKMKELEETEKKEKNKNLNFSGLN